MYTMVHVRLRQDADNRPELDAFCYIDQLFFFFAIGPFNRNCIGNDRAR